MRALLGVGQLGASGCPVDPILRPRRVEIESGSSSDGLGKKERLGFGCAKSQSVQPNQTDRRRAIRPSIIF